MSQNNNPLLALLIHILAFGWNNKYPPAEPEVLRKGPIPERVTAISYDDVNFEDWFASYLQVAYEKNYLEETSGKFYPHNDMSRAGVSEIIYRVMRSLGK